MSAFGFDHSYARELPGASVAWKPAPVPAPRLLFLNDALARELGLDPVALRADDAAAIFAGNALPSDAQPIAQAYAGHQFGGFSPQLGDGRALMLGEVVVRDGLHALGIPTTRALAGVATGEPVFRDTGMEPGAVLTCVAS
ncbi:MAG: hypothetical protein E6Q93_11295, partial [Burkholderiaceae bacterium]